MNKNQKEQKNAIKCISCGSLNSQNNNCCTKCGTPLNETVLTEQESVILKEQSTQKETKNQPLDKKNKLIIGIMIFLGIATAIIGMVFQKSLLVFFIVTLASLFNKKTKYYGISWLISVASIIVILVFLVIIIFLSLIL